MTDSPHAPIASSQQLGDADPPTNPPVGTRGTQLRLAAIVATALSLGSLVLSASEAAQGGIASAYDTSVYFLASLQMAQGHLPYKDFLFVQPPGILEILFPFSIGSHVFSLNSIFVLERSLTLLATSANVGLVAWILRRRGVTAMVASGVILGISSATASLASGIKLDPFFIFLVLLSTSLIFGNQPLGAPRRMRIAGGLIGIAIAVKFWAVVPLACLIGTVATESPKAAKVLLRWSVGVALLLLAPFIVLSPWPLLRDAVWLQVTRHALVAVSLTDRLTNLSPLQGGSGTVIQIGAAIWALVLAASSIYVLRRRRRRLLNVYCVSTMFVSALVVLIPTEFFSYYAYMYLPFAALVIGIAVSDLEAETRSDFNPAFRALACICILGLLCGGTLISWQYYRSSSLQSRNLSVKSIEHLVPRGSCVVADNPIITVLYDLQSNKTSKCDLPIDPAAMWMDYYANPENPPTALAGAWRHLLQHSDYVVLLSPFDAVIPWESPHGSTLQKWFDVHFRFKTDKGGIYIYKHLRGSAASSG